MICPLSAAAAVLAAIPLAWLARRGGWWSLPALLTAAAALAVPGPVLGLAIIKLLNQAELPWLVRLYDHSILAPFLALFVRGLPAAILVLWHALHSVPSELLDLAAVDGAGPLARLYRVALPMRWPAVGLAFLVSLGTLCRACQRTRIAAGSPRHEQRQKRGQDRVIVEPHEPGRFPSVEQLCCESPARAPAPAPPTQPRHAAPAVTTPH